MMTIVTKGRTHAPDRCGMDLDFPSTSDHWDRPLCGRTFIQRAGDAATFHHGEGQPDYRACLRIIKERRNGH